MRRTFDPGTKVILDSVSPEGIRFTTVQFRQPRMIHADFMTHREFSRNGRSSRAVPSARLLEEARYPYVPHFMKNQPGMTASEELSDHDRLRCEAVWRHMANTCRVGVEMLTELGVHKQWANRPLEWFGYIDVLVSSTSFENYFALRREGLGAQPEIEQIAESVYEALKESEPQELKPGQWHLPYVDAQIEDDGLQSYRYQIGEYGLKFIDLETAKKLSVARCARLTIEPFDGNGSIEAELARFDRLMTSQPVHASPAEHQATPDRLLGHDLFERSHWKSPKLWGNLFGWIQYRKTLPNEAVPLKLYERKSA